MKKMITFVVSFLLTLTLFNFSFAETTIRIASVSGPSHHHNVALNWFADKVNKQKIGDISMLLKAKAVDDDCENLWRIHNSLYDLSQWVNKHPGEFVGERKFDNCGSFLGGADWILLTKGTDITEAFETSHAFGVSPKLLQKFFVKETTAPRKVR